MGPSIFVFVNFGMHLGNATSSFGLDSSHIIMDVVLTSFEGFAIALLYCYLNGEVQEVIKGYFSAGSYTMPYRM